MSLSIRRIDSEAFLSLKEEWNDLLDRSRNPNVFLRWEWVRAWWTHFQTRKELFIWGAYRNDRLVGIAPFYINHSSIWGRRVLRMCSDELSPDYLDIILERGEELEVAPVLLRGLQSTSSRWDIVESQHLLEDSVLVKTFLCRDHWGRQIHRSSPCPYIKIQGSFKEYCASHAKQGFASFPLDRSRKQLFDKYAATQYRVTEEAELDWAIDQLFDLHEKRARSLQRTSFFAQPAVKRFHLEMSRVFLREKILNLQFLMVKGKPISTLYGFDFHKKTYFFNGGFDPEWKKVSPAAVLLYLMVEQSFAKGFVEFDFLKGGESYKSLWATGVRQQVEMRAYNKTLHGLFGYALAQGVATLRNIRSSASLNTQRVVREMS